MDEMELVTQMELERLTELLLADMDIKTMKEASNKIRKLEEINAELLTAVKEALKELEPTVSDLPGYYADPKQVERLRTAIKKAESK